MDLKNSLQIKLEYLESLPASDLAFWLIHSFSPERYHDPLDAVKPACELMYKKNSPLANEFVSRLWGMHGMLPPNVVQIKEFRK